MHIGMLLPRIDRDQHFITQGHALTFDDKVLTRSARLENQMKMRMRMVHQRGVHIEKRDASKTAAKDAQGLGHNFWFSEPGKVCARMPVRPTIQRLRIARIRGDRYASSGKKSSEMINPARGGKARAALPDYAVPNCRRTTGHPSGREPWTWYSRTRPETGGNKSASSSSATSSLPRRRPGITAPCISVSRCSCPASR